MNSEKLLAAMSGIDSRYITEAQDALCYRTGDKKRASHKTIWRTLFIAAVISALFTAAAAASGWFGISSLKLGTHRDTGRTVISLQGFAGSPENMAISELLEYCDAHPYSYKDSDLSEEEQLEMYRQYGGYSVHNREGYKKVDEICEKYGLRTLGEMSVPAGEKAFYEAAGTGRLTREHNGWESRYASSYIYEEGTFDMEGYVTSEELPCAVGFDFRRASKGTLGYVVGIVGDVNGFTEWDYKTSSGVTLHLANSESDDRNRRSSLILLDSDTAFYVMSFMHDGYADYLGDGIIDGIGDAYIEFNITAKQLEGLAESFDWAALTDPKRGMDSSFEPRESVSDAVSPADSLVLSSEPDFGSRVTEEELYYIKLAYKESIEPYISDFKLIDYTLIASSSVKDGWVQFSGTPKTKLDWECVSTGGTNIYCRSLNMSSDDTGTWTMGAAYDALPYKMMIDYQNIGTAESPDYVRVWYDMNSITSASLYVQQLGKSYSLPADKLPMLSLMLRDDGTPGAALNCESYNPIWLTFADGRTAVVYTAGNGSNGYTGGLNGRCAYGLGMSIFELFGVPLEAEGYSEHDGIVTAHSKGNDFSMLTWVEYDYIPGGFAIERRVNDGQNTRWSNYEYDEAGHLLRDIWHDPDGRVSNTITYTYDDSGKLLEAYTVNDRFWTRSEYIYDELGRLTLIKAYDDEHPEGNERAYAYYNYDSDGNCRVKHGFELVE